MHPEKKSPENEFADFLQAKALLDAMVSLGEAGTLFQGDAGFL